MYTWSLEGGFLVKETETTNGEGDVGGSNDPRRSRVWLDDLYKGLLPINLGN